MTTDTARHYAQKVRDTLTALHDAEGRVVSALVTRAWDSAAYEAARKEVLGLRATLALHAVSLADAVLAETAPCPAKAAGHACELPAGHEGEHTTHVYDNVTLAFGKPCGSEFAGHVCSLFEGHSETHHDTRTDLRWD